MRVWIAVAAAALAIPAAASAGTVFLLDGRGWGHGVGMSQWGAEGYARHGFDYRQILAHYYPRDAHRHRAAARRARAARAGEAVGARRVDGAVPRRRRARAQAAPAGARGRDRQAVHAAARPAHASRSASSRARSRSRSISLPYRGDVVVKAKPDGLMAVNVLPLDRYLRGVVPWEAPKGWHEQTYEAQAVAARSYTLATLKPGEDFDLYPDARSQMYGGVAAERDGDEPRDRRDGGAGARLARPDRPRLLLLVVGRTHVVGARRVADARPGAVPRLGERPVRLHLAAPRLADAGAVSREGARRCSASPGVRDIQVLYNSSGRARAVRVLTAQRLAGVLRARRCGRSSTSARWTSTSTRWSSTIRGARCSARPCT